MDRKKIYIAVIVVCVLASAGILYMNSQSQTELPDTIQPINTNIDGSPRQNASAKAAAGDIPQAGKEKVYPAPRTFPSDTALDLSLFQNSEFTNLTDYQPLTVGPDELGRPNPYQPY